MDLFRELVRLNNLHELQNKSKIIYESESDEDEDELEFIHSLRRDFINEYLKINNRQFSLSRRTLKKNNKNIKIIG